MAQSSVMKEQQRSSKVAEVTMVFVLAFVVVMTLMGPIKSLFVVCTLLIIGIFSAIFMTMRLLSPSEFNSHQPIVTLGQSAGLLLLVAESAWSYQKLSDSWYRTVLEDLPAFYAIYLFLFPWKRWLWERESRSNSKKKERDEDQ